MDVIKNLIDYEKNAHNEIVGAFDRGNIEEAHRIAKKLETILRTASKAFYEIEKAMYKDYKINPLEVDV